MWCALKSIGGFFYQPWAKLTNGKGPFSQPVSPSGLRKSLPTHWIRGGDEETVQKACDFWNDALRGAMFAVPFAEETPTEITIQYGDFPDQKTLGNTKWDDKQATITIKNKARCDWPLLAHELGHALGLEHSQDKFSIMYPTAFSFQRVTPEILEALKK